MSHMQLEDDLFLMPSDQPDIDHAKVDELFIAPADKPDLNGIGGLEMADNLNA